MTSRNTGLFAIAMLATTIAGSAVCGAQDVPRPPRPPRPPRAPSAWVGSDSGVTRVDTLVPFTANGSVELSLVSGTMTVKTWDRPQARIVATATGDARLQFEASGSHIDLEQASRGWRDRSSSGTVTYEVTVPTNVRATLSAVSGSIQATGVHGAMDVSSVSGRVDIRDAGATVAVEGVSGPITVVNVAGDLRVESVSAPLTVSNVGGTLSSETVSGRIDIQGVRGPRVRATTVSGAIDYAGGLAPSGRYDFESHSGRTTLRLPSNTSATLSVDTFSGAVSSEYPGAVRRTNSDTDEDNTHYEYVLGKGDARVHIETFSGRVIISQGNQ
jgi:DUF4097 and DUF4098 domain-containing protein YvlB